MPIRESSVPESIPELGGPDPLIERLERLEKENRRLIGVMVVVFLGSLVALVEGSGLVRSRSNTKEIEAEGFVVRDKTGVVRARLGLRSDGTPEVALHDSRGQCQVAVQAQSDGMALLSVYDCGEIRSALVASANGTSYIKYLDDGGKEFTSLDRSPAHETGVSLDRSGLGMPIAVKPGAPAPVWVSDKTTCDGMQVRPDTSRLRLAP